MDGQTQTCFKCGRPLPLTAFYTHPEMANGRLGKCKTCTKADTRKRKDELKADPLWVAQEKKRTREKERRLGWKRTAATYEQNRSHNEQQIYRFPEKRAARIVSQHIPREKGTHNHHWSYNKEDASDVINLTTMQHALVHRFMTYDQARMMYRRLDGTLIDSREAAIAYYATLRDE